LEFFKASFKLEGKFFETLKRIRFILIIPLLFLIALSNHRAYSGNYVLNKLTYSKYGPASYKEEIKKKQAFISPTKKPRKSRGIKVEIPYISEAPIIAEYHFTESRSPDFVATFSSAFFYENPLRGPPAV
jgi:hypothetical protein